MSIMRTPAIMLFFLFLFTAASAQQEYPSTLLWKISGKDLTKPSYLYGTMHLQDRRLFYFGDSLYAALEKADGFAMEINPDEMMDSLFKSLGKKDTSALLKRIMNEAEYKKIAKKLEKKFKTPADKITTKKLAEERKKMNRATSKKDDMPTIMDLYLFSIARRQGKHMGGIEDVADQFDIVDEIGKFNVDDFVRDDSAMRVSYLEHMVKIYINQDLTSLNKMVNGSLQNDFKDIMLIKRNRKMAMRMDSLSHERATFFAVGAAHLPGDSGVITLLRNMGYDVEPVISDKVLAPEDYKYTTKEIPWLKIEDENKMCSVEMPGTPSEMLAEGILPMKMYLDLAEMCVYGIAVTPVSEEMAKSDSLFERVIANYKRMGFDIKSTKNISYKDAKGIELRAQQREDGEFRYRLLVNGNKMFIIIFGGKNKDNLYGSNAEKFFASLSFNEKNIEGTNQWELFTSEKNAFSMMVPGKTVEGKPMDEEGTEYDQFTSVDYNDGSYYMVVVRDTKPGYFIESDSIYFEEYRKNLNTLTADNVKEFSVVKFKEYNACHFVASQIVNEQEVLIEGYLIRRGSRSYAPMVVMPKEKADFPGITKFFRSFSILPFKKTEWKKQNLGNTGVKTSSPGIFIKREEDTTAYNYNPRIKKFMVQDMNTAESYQADIEYLSPYYWSNSDSLFFSDRADGFKDYNDSILSFQYTDGPVKSGEALIQLGRSPVLKKLKFFLNGDTLYTFYTFQNEAGLNDAQAKTYFSEVQFSSQQASTVFTNKAAKLLQVLHSGDSAVVADARSALDLVEFTKGDLPLLYEALPKKYYLSKDDYNTVNVLLENIIAGIDDNSVVDFVDEQYGIKNDSTEDIQMLLLQLLAKHKTTESYKLLKKLLLNNAPQKGTIYGLVNAASDSLDLAKSFFPEATSLYADTITGSGMARLVNELLDSNLITATDALKNEKGLISLAARQYAESKKDKDAYPAYNIDIIALLGRFNTAESNEMLNRFSALPDMYSKNNAIIALLKNNRPVPASEIKKFAEDKEWRTEFYESLKKIGKAALFPKAYYSQLKFAEGYLYNSLLNDYEVGIKSMQFVKEKNAEINGRQQRFYIYKVVLDYDDEKTPRFAVCGAFDMDKSIAEIKDEDLDVYLNYDDEYSLSAIDGMFKKYIDEKIKSLKEN